MKNEYDIIIVGGGMVGAALACMLAQQTSLSILVLEAQTQSNAWSASQYHHRVSAISLASQRIFRSLGVWGDIKNKRISPYLRIQVWDAADDGEIHFDCNDISAPALGFIIENEVIQSSLHEKLHAYSSQVKIISPVSLLSYKETENGVEIVAADGSIFHAKLAVAADGARSWLREQAGIAVKVHDYEQEAIVGTVTTTSPHEKTARQIFLETGPIAFLPLAEANKSSIVWSLPVAEAKRLTAIDVNDFKMELAQAFAYKLGDVIDVEQRYSYPLRSQQADCYVKSRVVLVGDAAHTVHPLAGQGVNIGLLDAASLAEIISDAIKNRRDFSSIHQLRRYERWRKADNFSMLAGVDAIKNLFASDKKSIQCVRSYGLNLTNRMTWIKNIFTRHAVGNRSCLPILAR